MQIQTYPTGIIGRKIVFLPEISSTNDYAKDLLSKCEPFSEGTVIMAVHQTKGRGQHQALWSSEPGKNLTFSFLLNPSFLSPDKQFALIMAMSLALKYTVKRFFPEDDVCIKWPNDLYVQDKKLAGMLIENVLQGKIWKHAIVGIGLNVNQVLFSEEVKSRACSMAMLSGEPFDLNQVFQVLSEELNRYYLKINGDEQDLMDLKREYVASLYTFGEQRTFYIDDVPVKGKIIGITSSGRLQVDFDPQILDFGIKEIGFWPTALPDGFDAKTTGYKPD